MTTISMILGLFIVILTETAPILIGCALICIIASAIKKTGEKNTKYMEQVWNAKDENDKDIFREKP